MGNQVIQNIPAQRILDFVEAVAAGCTDLAAISAYVHKKPMSELKGAEKGHVRRAGHMAEILGLVTEADRDNWVVAQPDMADPAEWTDERRRLLFRARLQEFQPFLRFCDFVRRGMSSEDAAVRTSAVLHLEPAVTGSKNALVMWGEFAGIFVWEGNKLLLAESTQAEDLEEKARVLCGLEEALVNELSARSWLEKLMGRQAFDDVDPAIVGDLVKALMNYEKDPETALREAGKALEDYLKFIARTRGISLFDAKGRPIDQLSRLAQELRSKKVIADKHVNVLRGLETFLEFDVLQGLGAFRNMPSHGRNVEDWQRWSVGQEIAFCVVLQTVLTIRSLYFYAIRHKRVY